MAPRRVRSLVAGLLWLATTLAAGAELGALAVRSGPGERLDAEIEILALAPGEEKSLVARMASRAEFERARVAYHPALADVAVSLGRRGRRPVVQLRSSSPIDEPTLQVLVELQSHTGRYGRGYSLYSRRYTLVLENAQAPANDEAPPPGDEAALPTSRDALFGELPGAAPAALPAAAPPGTIAWRGFVQNYAAYDYEDPSHWSRGVFRMQLGAQGGGGQLKWKATARVDVDPVYAANDFYPPAVRDDQKRDFFLGETYVDTSLGGFDLRLGKQHIVWGEVVGLFFADVVSARDQRDFILPDFEIIRIPQWALRLERFGKNTHAEVIWLPAPEVDIIGKPGAEFYPLQAPPPAGFAQRFNSVVRPEREARNSNFGMRASVLRDGWDLAAFYYRSTDVNPTFYREIVLAPTPTVVFTPRHDRIWQVGTTLGKDLGRAVLKTEAIYTSGRKFNVTRLSDRDGVVALDSVDYIVGLDFTIAREYRLNVQYFDRVLRNYDPAVIQERREDGVSLLLGGRWGAAIQPELLLIRSLQRSEGLVRAKLGWIPARNWRLTFGVDVFSGPVTGLFGRFDDNDRVYLETRYDF